MQGVAEPTQYAGPETGDGQQRRWRRHRNGVELEKQRRGVSGRRSECEELQWCTGAAAVHVEWWQRR